jgi:hypothetical protein
MPRTVGAALDTHMQGEVTTLTTCIRMVRRDGTEFFFTEHDRDIVFSGDTYLASTGYNRTAIEGDASLTADNFEVTGIIDNAVLLDTELKAGLFDYAEVYMFIVNWADISQGAMKLKRGNLGEVSFMHGSLFKTEVHGMTKALHQVIGELYSPECRETLGTPRCGIPVDPPLHVINTAYALGDFIKVDTNPGPTYSQYENRIYECTVAGTTAGVRPTYDTIVGNTTVDGTATFTTREAWQRHATVNVVTDRRNFTLSGLVESRAVDDWFNYGGLTFETGPNAGVTLQIKDYVDTGDDVELLFATPFDITTAEVLRLYPGCDNRRTTCINKFDNIINYRGEPFIPGPDFLQRFPDAT